MLVDQPVPIPGNSAFAQPGHEPESTVHIHSRPTKSLHTGGSLNSSVILLTTRSVDQHHGNDGAVPLGLDLLVVLKEETEHVVVVDREECSSDRTKVNRYEDGVVRKRELYSSPMVFPPLTRNRDRQQTKF